MTPVPRSANWLIRYHYVGRDGLRDIVVLIAIGARKIAAANGDDVRHDGVVSGDRTLGDPISSPGPRA